MLILSNANVYVCVCAVYVVHVACSEQNSCITMNKSLAVSLIPIFTIFISSSH